MPAASRLIYRGGTVVGRYFPCEDIFERTANDKINERLDICRKLTDFIMVVIKGTTKSIINAVNLLFVCLYD